MNASNGSEEDFELRKGSWTFEEDSILMQYIASHGQGQWNMLAKYSGLKRSGRSCRLRWLNYLRPDIRRGNLTIQEQLLILELHSQFGNRWSKIAQHLPGRTDNEIKNYWRTRVQKQARQLKVDADSMRFLEAVRYFWMPRLIEQMEHNSSPPLSSCSSRSSLEIEVPSAFSTFQPKKKLESADQYHENHILVTNFTPEKIISKNYPNDDMEGFHLDTMSGTDTCDRFLPDSHMAEKDWVIDDMSSIVWDMDELW